MRNFKFNGAPAKAFLVSLVLVGIIIMPSVLSASTYNVNISSSGVIVRYGSIWSPALPLHTDGKYVGYPNGTHMVLDGVWDGMFADTSTGWWGTGANSFDEAALNQTLYFWRSHGVNVLNTFIWGDWWLGNYNATLMGGNGQTNIGLRDAIIRTVQCVEAYGMYFQIRLYGANRTQGGDLAGNPWVPTQYWNNASETLAQSMQSFTNFWLNVSTTLNPYPNVLYALIDEPVGNATQLYQGFNSTVTAIRATGDNNIIVLDKDYCGDMAWVGDYVSGGYNYANCIFDEHIYSSLGTFHWTSNFDPSINAIRAVLNSTVGEPTGTMTNYTQWHYNVPVWVGAIGCDSGVSNDLEYVGFWNTLAVLNEMNIGYVEFSATRTGTSWGMLADPVSFPTNTNLNRVGQALVDSIAGITPPPTYQLNVSSNEDPVLYQLNGTTFQSPHNHMDFAGIYNVTMPSSKIDYSHSVLFGSTLGEGGSGSGYNPYVYSGSPYSVSTSTTVSSVYVYAATPGNVEVAIYHAVSKTTPDYWYASTLAVANNTKTPCSIGWNLITFTPTLLTPGNYTISVHAENNYMLVNGPLISFSGMTWSWNWTSNTFDANVSNISDTQGANIAAYVPYAPLVQTLQHFQKWEDGSTNPVRTINLTTNMNLTATYQTTP